MPDKRAAKVEKKRPAVKKKDRATEIANTFEWLITAFILAFVFRAFVMEAFRIPTGSMADTLKGAHFRLRCPQCGYAYDYGFVPESRDYRLPQDTVPLGTVPTQRTHCPSCGYYLPPGEQMPVANGDRILVLKCVYQLVDPKRWDVVVFKNPINPTENYIKRLIGLPGDTIEIIDGDVYINGLIARKPPAVQKELWMPIYDNDFQPINPEVYEPNSYSEPTRFNGHKWQLPFHLDGTAWKVSAENPTQWVLDCPPGRPSVLKYGTAPSANGFTAIYSYDDVHTYRALPTCSDLMLRYYVRPENREGGVGITLSKYGIDYQARLDLSGKVTLVKVQNGRETVLATKEIAPLPTNAFTLVKFANVDHQLLFACNDQELAVDLGRTPTAMEHASAAPPRAEIFGSGKLTLAHLALFRDIYYTSDGAGPRGGRAVEGRPFKLNKDEFFVLGDNSPNSEDGRWWGQPERASTGWAPPRAGVVPRYYLVGKALFVYWPSGFEFPWAKTLRNYLPTNSRNLLVRLLTLRSIPNVGKMRFIYGGTGKTEPPARAVQEHGVADASRNPRR